MSYGKGTPLPPFAHTPPPPPPPSSPSSPSLDRMAPANRAWIRLKMATIKKSSGIAFSEEIFLSILICLIARHKHLVLHTSPDAVPELKSIVEQHSAVVFGLTTATIVCHGQQTRTDIISAITGRHANTAAHPTPSTPSSQHLFSGHYHHPHHQAYHTHPHPAPEHYYQYSNPVDEYAQRSTKLRFEKSRRSIATNHSEASDYSLLPSDHHAAPSIASFKTVSERDLEVGSLQRNSQHEPSGGNDSLTSPRQSDSRSKGTGDAVTEHVVHGRTRKAAMTSPLSQFTADQSSIDNNSNRRTQSSFGQTSSHPGGSSVSHGQAPVTPVDFTFPRRRHESVPSATGYGGAGGETSGITYGGKRIAQAIILDGLENASQEVFAVLLEMIISKEINDRNRYVPSDLIIIAIFSSPDVPDNIPKELLDYFAINGSYESSVSQPRIHPLPARKHALFRKTEWEELSKRMKAVTVSNDMRRYTRDVIVGIRTHEAVQGGLTSRAALDLEAIIRTLAAIFQTTFVTPDLLTIAAEKVFSHRLELKSTRRRKMLAAATFNSSMSSSPAPRPSHSHGKLPLTGYRRTESRSQRHDAQGGYSTRSPGQSRRSSSSSDQSSDGGASFVELSDSDESGSSGASIVVDMDAEHDEEEREDVDETTAADVVRDILRVVYPPV